MAARANISQWSIGGDFGEPAGTPSSHRGGRRHEMREPQQQPNVGIVPGVGGAPPRPAGVSSNRSNLGNGDIIGHSPNQSHGNLQPWRGSSRASTSSSPQHQGGYAQQHRSDLPPKHGSYQQQTAVHKHPNNSIPIYSQNRGPSTNEADADDYFMRYSSRHQQHGAPGLQLGAEIPRGAASFYSNSVSSSVREEIYEQRRQLYYSGRRLQPPPQLPNTPQGQGLPPRPVQPAQSQPAAHTGHESSQEEPNFPVESIKSGRQRVEVWERRKQAFIQRRQRQQSAGYDDGTLNGQFEDERVQYGRRAGVPRSDSLRCTPSAHESHQYRGDSNEIDNLTSNYRNDLNISSNASARSSNRSSHRPPGGASSIQLG